MMMAYTYLQCRWQMFLVVSYIIEQFLRGTSIHTNTIFVLLTFSSHLLSYTDEEGRKENVEQIFCYLALTLSLKM